jgi:hypothetical protein
MQHYDLGGSLQSHKVMASRNVGFLPKKTTLGKNPKYFMQHYDLGGSLQSHKVMASRNVGFLPKKRRWVKTQNILYNITTSAEAFNHIKLCHFENKEPLGKVCTASRISPLGVLLRVI